MTQSRSAQDEAVDLLVDLLRINTSKPTHPERPAAEWVAEKLDDVGIESQIIEAAPGRASTIARIEGTDSSRKPLLVHGHLDVVRTLVARGASTKVRDPQYDGTALGHARHFTARWPRVHGAEIMALLEQLER